MYIYVMIKKIIYVYIYIDWLILLSLNQYFNQYQLMLTNINQYFSIFNPFRLALADSN